MASIQTLERTKKNNKIKTVDAGVQMVIAKYFQ